MLRWLVLVLALVWSPVALAGDDGPLSARYTVRGVEPYGYLGYGEFVNKVRGLVMRDKLALPQNTSGWSFARPDLAILTEAALSRWGVRRLTIQQSLAPTANGVNVRLTWPSDIRALNEMFPFRKIREAFERSLLDADSPEWIAQRNQMWPDPENVAARIIVGDRVIDTMRCPKVLAGIRQMRDAPAPFEFIPRHTQLGDTVDKTFVVTADGWGITFWWNGGPDSFEGGLSSPNQSSALGEMLLNLVGEAEICAGLTRTVF